MAGQSLIPETKENPDEKVNVPNAHRSFSVPACELDDHDVSIGIKNLFNDGFIETTHLTEDPANRAYDACQFNLAQSVIAQGKYAKAIEVFQVLIARRPDNPRPKLQLANCLLALGRFDECRQTLDQALILDVPEAYASQTRGRVELMSENFDAALEYFFDVQQTYPDYQGIDTLIGTTYARMEKFEQAKMAFEKALAKNPDDEHALFELGKHHARSGRSDLAVESFLQAISIRGRFLEAHFALGQSLAEIGELVRAKIAFQRCLALQPDWESPAVELAKLDAAD